ncbi:uncharacterized protein LOC141588627 [Silene latifolia]|uniref:uncharacterized protein LOC141588627 n=1 Tax=Silene latifolia TaxID=37657 RepID=UPI003D78547A
MSLWIQGSLPSLPPMSLEEKLAPQNKNEEKKDEDDDGEGWTLVTRRKPRKQVKQMEQESLSPVTLEEFFPEDFLNKISVCTISAIKALSFLDEDLLLGSNPHNRPLYVSGYIRGQKVKCILIDGGSRVNLMPKATMNELGTTMDEHSNSRTVIHGFNLNKERAVGMIRINLSMGDLSSDTLFHVNEGKTSFKLLLGRPWKHENEVVSSTLHQCLKYYCGGERKIDGDAKPFSKADSFFADAKFFEENGTSSEFMPTNISSTRKGGMRENNIIKEDAAASPAKKNDVKKDVDKASKIATSVVSPKKQDMAKKTTSPVLRYIPKSCRKDGESPFAECLTPKTQPKDKKSSQVIKQEWVAKIVAPLPSSSQTKIMRPLPTCFICSSSQSLSEGNKRIFDSNAYKLLAKAGYEFTNPTPLGKVIEIELYRFNKAQHELFKQDGSFMVTKAGLGYESHAPVKIGARRKGATTSYQHITVEKSERKMDNYAYVLDFRDLNDACPKDDFPLPVTELMIDTTTGHEALSSMDYMAGYNQIHMAPEDQEATGFRTPKGIFC